MTKRFLAALAVYDEEPVDTASQSMLRALGDDIRGKRR